MPTAFLFQCKRHDHRPCLRSFTIIPKATAYTRQGVVVVIADVSNGCIMEP